VAGHGSIEIGDEQGSGRGDGRTGLHDVYASSPGLTASKRGRKLATPREPGAVRLTRIAADSIIMRFMCPVLWFLHRGPSVSLRRPSNHLAFRLFGIILLIPGLLRIPLPQVDYHNIRHHHAVGETCPYHDHLLRWHPTAARDSDVAMLHWHWLIPQSSESDNSSPSGEDQPAPSGPAMHANLLDCLEPEWTSGPLIRPDGRARSLIVSAPGLTSLQVTPDSYLHALFTSRASGMPGIPEGLTPWTVGGAHRRLERWNC
jgi:hypothetical protein